MPALVENYGQGGEAQGSSMSPGIGAATLAKAVRTDASGTNMTIPTVIGELDQRNLSAVVKETVVSESIRSLAPTLGRIVPPNTSRQTAAELKEHRGSVDDRQAVFTFAPNGVVWPALSAIPATPGGMVVKTSGLPRRVPELVKRAFTPVHAAHREGMNVIDATFQMDGNPGPFPMPLAEQGTSIEVVSGRAVHAPFAGLGDAFGGVFSGVFSGIGEQALTMPDWRHDTPSLKVASGISDAVEAAAMPELAGPPGASPGASGLSQSLGASSASGANPVLAAGDRVVKLTGEMNVTFEGAPPGMRVETLKTNQPDVESKVHVGYRSLAMGT